MASRSSGEVRGGEWSCGEDGSPVIGVLSATEGLAPGAKLVANEALDTRLQFL